VAELKQLEGDIHHSSVVGDALPGCNLVSEFVQRHDDVGPAFNGIENAKKRERVGDAVD
jgi:hypothetical protein